MQLTHRIIPPFATLNALWIALGATRKKGDWRLVEPQVGQFHALPNMRGVCIASNGMVLIVQKPSGEFVEGHVTSWVKDSEENEASAPNPQRRSRPTVESTHSRQPSKALLALLE